ncbi:MAG: SPOR domain-containing protein [Calditrichaeota bacterium]|nr:SPOR domain-containing protein [Calditrichota bacterium]MCB9474773.1 SPOR domain-containing protein [Candidatus Delongbacteria bacterium]
MTRNGPIIARVRGILLVALLGPGLSGCLAPAVEPSPAQDRQSEAGQGRGATSVTEFDPLLLPESPITLAPAPVVDTPPVRAKKSPASPALQEFGVQIYSGPDQLQAEAAELAARELFPGLPVRLLQNETGCKVVLGRFESIEEANDLKQQARQLGYETAWVIRAAAEAR